MVAHGLPAAGVPWFVTLFGRDSLVVSLQNMMVSAEFRAGCSGDARRAARYGKGRLRDEQPGKIMHEIRHGELAHFHLVPHTPYYGTWDATPLYLITLHETWKWLGDVSLLHAYRDAAEKCLEWIDKYGDLRRRWVSRVPHLFFRKVTRTWGGKTPGMPWFIRMEVSETAEVWAQKRK